MIFPTVHLNGSGKENLREQYKNAYSALLAAEEAVRQAYPHGRDYYPQGDGVINQAMEEHRDRQRRLEALMDEYVALAESLDTR